MLCSKCGKREAIIKIDGYNLCKNCAINEINNKVRKLVNISKILENKQKVIITYLYFNDNIANILFQIVSKITAKRNLKVEMVDLSESDTTGKSISEVLWRYLINLKKIYDENTAYFSSFTSDFLLTYFLYSTLTGDRAYLPLVSLIYTYAEKVTLFQPLISIPSYYLSVFGEWRIKQTGDNLFDELFNWGVKNLYDNPDLFRTFTKSLDLYLTKNRCRVCGALIPEGSKLCSRCSKILASPFHP